MDTFLRFKKPLLFIAAALVIAEIAWAAYTLTRPVNKNSQASEVFLSTPVPEPTSSSKAEVALVGPSSVKVGESFKVDINLTTNSPTIGADLIIKYDPQVLEVVLSGEKAATPGKTYQEYPANSIDSNGVITISGVTTSSTGFSGEGLFGSINFKAKALGSTKITLDYKPSSTTDSNVTEVSSGSDILKTVTNLDLKIN